MFIKSEKFDDQLPLFVVGLVFFSVIAFFGWIKLKYGFPFLDEGFHMTSSWRVAEGDHLLTNTRSAPLLCFTLLNSFIFKIIPDITLLEFRQIQFFATIASLGIFGAAIYFAIKQYWFLPFVFSIFAFTGLDASGATSNLNYYTYPHLFLTLFIACFILGITIQNDSIKLFFFILAGISLWGISLSVLHLSLIILSPVLIFLLKRPLNLITYRIKFRELLYILAPFLVLWGIFFFVYKDTYFISLYNTIQSVTASPYHSAVKLNIDLDVLQYVGIMVVFLLAFFLIIRQLTQIKTMVPALLVLSILAFVTIDTSMFGLIDPYWKDWFSRPMWFAAALIVFHAGYWIYLLKKIVNKEELKRHEQIALIIMIPSTLLFINASYFSGFGLLLVLHASIPVITVISLFLLLTPRLKEQPKWIKLLILIFLLTPFYYTTAWSDWNFTYCDVKPEDANYQIDEGFGQGIKTNGIYKKLYYWIRAKTDQYTTKDDFLISYPLTPMVYMIAERRPAIPDSFLNPPVDWNQNHYSKQIEKIKNQKRIPAMVFVFDNTPAFNTIKVESKNDEISAHHSLKGNHYTSFKPIYNYKTSKDPLSVYIQNHMKMIESVRFEKNTIWCFVDKSRLKNS